MTTKQEAAILVVEDDENLRLALSDNLEDEGFEVQAVGTGVAGVEAAAAREFDLIILDIMLPDIDGYTVCERLRKAGNPAKILMLTARTLEDDLVRGFDAGADDYLAKPYRLRELLARIGALLRRGRPELSTDAVAFAGRTLDKAARVVADRDGRVIQMTRTEFDLLSLFLANLGKALSRETILDQVWGQDVMVDPRTVDNFVSNLKRKLDCRPNDALRFRTVRGVGYRMELDTEPSEPDA